MEKRVKVVLYGDTLLLAALHASLAGYSGLDVVAVENPLADEREVCTLAPDVVIVDIAAAQPASLYLLGAMLSNLLLVGVDAARERVLVWSGRQLSASSTRELVNLIGAHLTVRPYQEEPSNT